ncbi:hypothetical protein RND71_023791 [Anisodus tanguticus]|uniref:Arp2/3 complex 41 kDa subunit n=1 Tax=Anisodus tanguticus TaxID=243964 RepID=A0AAE1VBX3_9SOLA|nr:hypothetical protein RND71_023791 [Anisodus tanguticus]
MAATSVHKFAQCITCHAWSPDLSMIVLCPNNSEVHIYKLSEDKWERVHVLQKHDQIVSGIDWSYRSNKIVTVSHDRNSYVWNQEATGWVPTLVILRLNRAALCVQWSPKENKFAVGSGAKTVCICYYEQENNWWVSKLIRKRHDSSVTSIAWHPNNILLATTSTDGKCRVFSTFIKGVDAKDSGNSADTRFGEQIVQLDLCFCWAFGVRWSPSGNTLAYVAQPGALSSRYALGRGRAGPHGSTLRYWVLDDLSGHNSMIYFVDEVGPSAAAQSVAIRDLPLRDVLFLSERMVVGVGFDCNPMVFVADESGLWSFLRFLDERKAASSSAKYGSQFSEAFEKFYGQSKFSASNNVEQSRGAHDNFNIVQQEEMQIERDEASIPVEPITEFEPLETKSSHEQNNELLPLEQNDDLLMSEPEQNNALLPSEPDQNNELFPSEPEQKKELLPSEPELKKELLPYELAQKNELLPFEPEQKKELLPSEPEQKNELFPSEPEQNNELLPSEPEQKNELRPSESEQNGWLPSESEQQIGSI